MNQYCYIESNYYKEVYGCSHNECIEIEQCILDQNKILQNYEDWKEFIVKSKTAEFTVFCHLYKRKHTLIDNTLKKNVYNTNINGIPNQVSVHFIGDGYVYKLTKN